MVNGLLDGLRIGFGLARWSCSRARANMASTSRDAALVSRYLDEECCLGRVVGPLPCSPIGLVPKSSGGVCLIVDLSCPHGRRVDHGGDEALYWPRSTFVACIACSQYVWRIDGCWG